MTRCNATLRLLLCLVVCLAGSQAASGGEQSGPEASKTADVYTFGAVGDGAADDTAAIEAAVASKNGAVRLSRGTYRITRPIEIDLDRVGPTAIAGDGTATLVMDGPGAAIRFIGTHQGTAAPDTVKPNVWQHERMPAVDGLEIVGNHPQACGIEASGTMQLTITRVDVRRVLHAIHLVERNRNVIVSNCHLYENRGGGLFLDDVDLHQTNVTGCHISYNAAGGVVSRSGNVRNLHISGCDIEGNMSADGPPTANVLIDCSASVAGTAEVAVTGCTIQHSHTSPGSANIRYVGTGADGENWGHVCISGNVLSDVAVNVDIQQARGVSILGNTFWKGTEHNLRVNGSSNVLVGPNLFDRNPRYRDEGYASNGILFRDCRDCTLTGLHVNGVTAAPAGIVLEKCRRMNLTGLTILDCQNAGLLLRNVTDSRVSGCLIQNDLAAPGDWAPTVAVDSSDNVIEGPLIPAGAAEAP